MRDFPQGKWFQMPISNQYPQGYWFGILLLKPFPWGYYFKTPISNHYPPAFMVNPWGMDFFVLLKVSFPCKIFEENNKVLFQPLLTVLYTINKNNTNDYDKEITRRSQFRSRRRS